MEDDPLIGHQRPPRFPVIAALNCTATVVTLDGRQKVRTEETVQGTIPVMIS